MACEKVACTLNGIQDDLRSMPLPVTPCCRIKIQRSNSSSGGGDGGVTHGGAGSWRDR